MEEHDAKRKKKDLSLTIHKRWCKKGLSAQWHKKETFAVDGRITSFFFAKQKNDV